MTRTLTLRYSTIGVALIGALVCGWFEVFARDSTAGHFLSLGTFSIWVASPFFVLIVLAFWVRGVAGLSAMLVLAVLMIVLNTLAYYDTLFVHIDAQGALVFVFLPLWQLLGLLFITAGIAVVKIIRRRVANTSVNPDVPKHDGYFNR